MLWYQQLRNWVIALSLATLHVIGQGFRHIYDSFKPVSEDLPVSTPGSPFTPKHDSITTDPEIALACRLYLATRASRMARFSMSSQPSSPLPNNPTHYDDSKAREDPCDTLGNVTDDTSCAARSQLQEDPPLASHFDLTPSSSYDSPSEYGTTPPSSPNLDLPFLFVSAPTEEDLKLNCFQKEFGVTSDGLHPGMNDEVEVEELTSPELSIPDDLVVFRQAIHTQPKALVPYKPTTTNSNDNHDFVSPAPIPLKSAAPLFQEPFYYSRALRDSLLLSPPPFYPRRRHFPGDLARRRGFKGPPINTPPIQTLLIPPPIVVTPSQSFALPRSAKSTFSAVVDRVRASATPNFAKVVSVRREAKRVPPSFQSTYEEAGPFSTHADSFHAPGFSHSSDINNVGQCEAPENLKETQKVELKLRRRDSSHDLRTEEVKTFEMKTTIPDMSIYDVSTQDESNQVISKPRGSMNPLSAHTEPCLAFEGPPSSGSIVSTCRPESAPSHSVSFSSLEQKISIGNKMFIDEETGDPDIHSEPSFVDDSFMSDVRSFIPISVPPEDFYNSDIYAPWRSFNRTSTYVWPSSPYKAPRSEAEELQRLSTNVSAYTSPFSFSADPLSSSSESDFSSTEDVPHIRAILDDMDFSPLLAPCFESTLFSTPVSVSFLDLDAYIEPLSCIPSELDSPVIMAPVSAAKSEVVPASAGNDKVGDFNVNMAPRSAPNGQGNLFLRVIQPGADPTAILGREEAMAGSSAGTTEYGPSRTCPNLERSSVIAVSGGLGWTEVPRASQITFESIAKDDTQRACVECLNQTTALTSTAEGNISVANGFLESQSSRYRNLEDEVIKPLGRRVGIYGSLPRQRTPTSRRRSSSLSDHNDNQTRARVLERHRASVLYSASLRRSGIQALLLPQRLALRGLNPEVKSSPCISEGSTLESTEISTFLDDAKEPPLSEADQNRNSLDALIALIESDMKASSNPGKTTSPSFQMSTTSQYSMQWGVAF